jgi:nucleoside-diphosphate-sugar epimerase
MSKYFITGGAGFLGINLTRYLLEKGHSVVSYDFSEEYDYPEKDLDTVTVVREDIRHQAPLFEAMRGSDMVVHCAAALPLYSKNDIFTTDVGGTKNVLEAARSNDIDRVVMISSTAVYGIPDHHPLVEEDELIGVGSYGEAKIAAEQVCLNYRDKGMCVPIIRPKSFVGPERLGVFALFYDWAQDGRGFPMIGSGNNRYQLLDVQDLCEAIYLCTTFSRDIVNDTFNIGAAEFTTMGEDYQAVLDRAGFGKKIKGFPAAPMIWTLRFLELLHLSPLYKWVYETASKDSFVSIEKAKRVLGYSPVYSNKDALLRNYQWYLDNMDRFRDNTGVSHRVPWRQGILKLAKVFF